MNLREFRAKEVNEVCDTIATKIQSLRTYTLADFMYLLYQASKEFPELAELIPDEKTIRELMGIASREN